MYITRLHVKNMKLIRDLTLDFTHEGKPRMWTVFVAENGACKTTLLQAIALAASGSDRANQLANVPSLPDLRRSTDDVEINADFKFGIRQGTWRRFPSLNEKSDDLHELVLKSFLNIWSKQLIFSSSSAFALPRHKGMESPSQVDEQKFASQQMARFEEARRALMLARETLRRLQKIANPGVRESLVSADDSRLESLAVELKQMMDESEDDLGLLGHPDPLSEARSKSFSGWFVAGYGTQRQLPVPLSASEQKDRVLNRLEPLFGKAPLVGTGFANQFEGTPFFEPLIQSLQKIFVGNRLLPHVDAVELSGRGGMSQSGDLIRSHSFEFAFAEQKTKIPAVWLSQGYQSTIAWIVDLIGQIYLDAGEPISLEDMEGIVLIDELDLHLHPTWQARLVPVLKRVFPNMQFIVTTHSPMLLPALERHEIVMLRLDEKGDVVAESPPASPKLMTGSEIYSSFFNIQKLYPNDLGDELRRYTYLSSDPTRTDAEDAAMLGLQKKLTDAGLDLGLPPVPRDMS